MNYVNAGSVVRDEIRQPNRIRNNELVRDAAVRILSRFGLEGTNFNSVSIDAQLSNSVLRKRFSDIDALLVDTWQNRSINGFIKPLNMTIMSYLLSEPGEDHQHSKQLLNIMFDLNEVQCASLEILAVTASHDPVCDAVGKDLKAMFNQSAIKSDTMKAQYVFFCQIILGALLHFRSHLLDRDLLVERLHQLLVLGISPSAIVPIPEVDASYIREQFVSPEQSPHSELMNACLTCVAENGFAATTTKMIAKQALVSEGKLFSYFPTKLDLFLEAISNQVEQGFMVNFKHTTIWAELYGTGVAAAILVREYQRPDLDLARALQIEYLRLSWHRSEIFDKRLKHIHKVLIDLGVENVDAIGPEQNIELMLSAAGPMGAMIVARLDREAFKLPYAVVTQKVYS